MRRTGDYRRDTGYSGYYAPRERDPYREQKVSPAVWVLIGLVGAILLGVMVLIGVNMMPDRPDRENPPAELPQQAEEQIPLQSQALPEAEPTPEPEPTPAQPTPTPRPASPQEELYRQIYDQVEDFQQTVTFTTEELNKDQVMEVLQQIQRCPEFFWLDGSTYYITGSDYRVEFNWKYTDPEQRQIEVEQAAQEALASIPAGAGDYEKALALHDWLCEHIDYQYNSDGSDQDLYGALAMGKCVCAGYCAAYEYLLEQVGIEADTVRGDADNGSWTESHAWTKLVLDGDIYYTDVTWDDQKDHPDGRTYSWFAVTSDQMAPTHFPNPEQGAEMTPSTATACNYYYHNGWVLEEYDTADLTRILASQKGDSLTVMAADEEIYQQLLDLFRNANDALDLLERAGHPASQYSYFMTDGAWNVDIFPEN